MRLLADENVARPIYKIISQNHDITHVNDVLKGATDEEVIDYAAEERRIIITFDDDFTRLEKDHKGVFYITKRAKYSKVAEAVNETLKIVNKQDLKNEVYMISP